MAIKLSQNSYCNPLVWHWKTYHLNMLSFPLPRSSGKKMLQGGFGDFYFYEIMLVERQGSPAKIENYEKFHLPKMEIPKF